MKFTHRSLSHGFSLVEVLVALIIISVGMLGIAKIQAMAYATTGTAALRSLAAIQAASLTASMRANRNYWTVPPTPLTVTITGSAVTSASDPALCIASCPTTPIPLSPAAVASVDLTNWATAIAAVLPTATATISCPTPVPGTTGVTPPVGCTIQMNWVERNGGINTQSTGTVLTSPTYTLYVEP
jgi:type IV pilus assembly protein PilV